MLPTLLLLSLAGSTVASPAAVLNRRGKGPITVGLKTSTNKPPTPAALAGSSLAADDTLAEETVNSTSDNQSIYYFVDVEIGTPPQKLEVLMDTGSTKTVVWSDLCNDVQCNTDHVKFSPNQSSTFNWTGQDARIQYGGGQVYIGEWGTDTISFAGLTYDDYGFQVITASNKDGTPIKYGSGVLGLSWTRADGDPSRSISQKIADDSDDKRFGIYLDRIDEQNYGKTNESTSELTLNGIDKTKIDGNVTMVDIYTNAAGRPQGWWADIDGLKFGDRNIKLDGLHMGLFDTGAPGIGMPDDLVVEFYKGISNAKLQDTGVWTFPCNTPNLNVTLIIGGVEWPVYWGDLVRPMDATATLCRGTVVNAGNTAPDESYTSWLVGATFLKNVYAVYSYQPPQVGFAKLKDEYNVRTNRVPRQDGKYAASNSNSTDTAPIDTADASATATGGKATGTGKTTANGNNNNGTSANGSDSSALTTAAPGILAAIAGVALSIFAI